MRTKSNILFTIIVAFFLSGVAISLVFSLLPDEVSISQQSVLEGREYTKLPTHNRTTQFLEGKLQDTFESFISDRVPFRESVVLANASLQRRIIETANLPYGFAAYPTYFESERVSSSATHAIYKLPALPSQYSVSDLKATGSRIRDLVNNYPSIKWAFCLIDNTETTSANPAATLVSRRQSYSDVLSVISESLDGTKCIVIDGGFENEDEYLDSFFKTDHHMQIQGAMMLHERIMNSFEKEPVQVDAYQIVFADEFFGSDARVGLDADYSDVVWDAIYNRSNLSVSINNKKKEIDALDAGWSAEPNYKKTSKFENVYREYFHRDYNYVIIENKDIDESAGSLLLLSDSYDNSSSRIYAERYKRVYEVSCKSGLDIPAFLDSHPDVVDAAIILCPQYLNKLLVY